MCGRARCSLAPEIVVAEAARYHGQTNGASRWRDREWYKPSYNVSPGAWLPVLRPSDAEGHDIQAMRWGLIPSFTKHGNKLDFYTMMNARSETVAEKPAFRRLLSSKRCVVLLDGFYEWKKEGSTKQPYYVHCGEGKVLRMAGLYDTYKDESGNVLHSVTILTVDSCPKLAWLHDRMPAILPTDEAVHAWLNTDTDNVSGSGHEGGDAKHGAQTQSPSSDPKAEVHAFKEENKSDAHAESELKLGHCTAVPEEEQPDHVFKGPCSGFAVQMGVNKLVAQVCSPYNGPDLAWHPVTAEMTKPSFDSPSACKDVRTKKSSITSFFGKTAGKDSGRAGGKDAASDAGSPKSTTIAAPTNSPVAAAPAGAAPASIGQRQGSQHAASRVSGRSSAGSLQQVQQGAAAVPLNTDEQPADAVANLPPSKARGSSRQARMLQRDTEHGAAGARADNVMDLTGGSDSMAACGAGIAGGTGTEAEAGSQGSEGCVCEGLNKDSEGELNASPHGRQKGPSSSQRHAHADASAPAPAGSQEHSQGASGDATAKGLELLKSLGKKQKQPVAGEGSPKRKAGSLRSARKGHTPTSPASKRARR